jgi:hypothetical protein
VIRLDWNDDIIANTALTHDGKLVKPKPERDAPPNGAPQAKAAKAVKRVATAT